ncbi:MAG: MFS transporter [Anaerolineae bacterium]
MKLNYGQVFVLGFGFLGVTLLWNVYNAFVPIFLQAGNEAYVRSLIEQGRQLPQVVGFGIGAGATGFVMTLDNIAAVFIQPWIGVRSDKTRTRLGRRHPYILASAPVAALGFMLIPYAARAIPPNFTGQLDRLTIPFALFIGALGITLLAAAVFRTPAVALMPDIVPSKYRSQANGIINLMGGVGAILGFFAGGLLFDIDITLPFIAGGIVVILAAILVVTLIREPRRYETEDKPPDEVGVIDNLKEVWREDDKSMLFLLLAIFFWFVAFNVIETFFTSFAVFSLGQSPGRASVLLAVVGLTFMIFAVPAGFIAERFGRRPTIIVGLVGMALAMGIIFFVPSIIVLWICLALAGIMWALVNINSLPMVVDSAPQHRLGAYTGLYYFSSMSAAVVGPVLVGGIIDLLGTQHSIIFLVGPLALLAAFLCLSRVSRGEVLPAGEPTLTQPLEEPLSS